MQNKKLFSVLLLVGLFVATSVAASAQGWRKLGDKEVGYSIDHDTIGVSEKGQFTQLKIKVMKAPVRFSRVVVTFGNGRTQELEFREFIQAGGETRAIDLNGDERFIKRVDFWYDTASLGNRKAKVILWGRS